MFLSKKMPDKMKNDQRKRFWGVGALAVALAATLAGCADMGGQGGGVQGALQGMDDKLRYGLAKVTGSTDVGEWYTPISGPQTVKGIYAGQWNAYGQIKWPRVALQIDEWGPNLHCWSYTAIVWKDERTSHEERFRLCDNAPTPPQTDPTTGETRQNVVPESGAILMTNPLPSNPNTGEVRTSGPKPPHNPFGIFFHDGESLGKPSPMQAAYQRQLSLLSLLTHFQGHEDPRMWIYRFVQTGKHS